MSICARFTCRKHGHHNTAGHYCPQCRREATEAEAEGHLVCCRRFHPVTGECCNRQGSRLNDGQR